MAKKDKVKCGKVGKKGNQIIEHLNEGEARGGQGGVLLSQKFEQAN